MTINPRIITFISWCIRIGVFGFALAFLTIGSLLPSKFLTDLFPISSNAVAAAVWRGILTLLFLPSVISVLPIISMSLYQSRNPVWKQVYGLTSLISLYFVYTISSNFIQLGQLSLNQLTFAKTITFIITIPVFNWLGRQWAKEKIADFSAKPGTVGELMITRFATAIIYVLLSIFFLFGAGLISFLTSPKTP